MKRKRPCLITFPNTEKRVENTARSGIFLVNLEKFGTWSNNVVNAWYISSIETTTKEKKEKWNSKNKIMLIWSGFQIPLRSWFNLHDAVTWCEITHTGTQVAQRRFQNKATRTSPRWPPFVLNVPLSFECPTLFWMSHFVLNLPQRASQHVWLCTIWPDRAKGLFWMSLRSCTYIT